MTADTACSHYCNTRCLWASARIANRVFATGYLCQVRCRELGGPCDGRAPKGDDFARAVFSSIFCKPGEARFLALTRKKHQGRIIVAVPEIWSRIKADLAELLELPGVQGARLTGSVIYPQRWSGKDVDVNVRVASPTQFPTVFERRPAALGGHRCDIFPYTRPNPLYPTLDCDAGILYMPKWIPWDIDAPGLTVTVDEDPEMEPLADLLQKLERDTRP